MRRPVADDVIAVLEEIRHRFELSGSEPDVQDLRKEAIRAIARIEVDARRFANEVSADNSIHDACVRRLGYTQVAEFDAAVDDWLRGRSDALSVAVLVRVTTEGQRQKLAEVLGISDSQPTTPPVRAVDFHDAAEPERRETVVNRIIRDTAMTRELKQRYQNRCQICHSAFPLGNGVTYSEAHHIRPLGEPHNGPDTEDNILILCPNHHAQCDFCAIKLVLTSLDRLPDHILDEAHIDYHNGRCR